MSHDISIHDTANTQKLRMLSLCTGIGGADLAAEATGHIQIVGQVEIDPFCQTVLAKHWPHVVRMSDIREVVGHEFGRIDILVAGIPCQGNSLAGQRKGAQDERNLWPETRRIIRAAQPRWIVVENVVGLLSVDAGQLFGSILAELDEMGYRVGWAVYGAAEVGAPHQRERVFLLAYADSHRQWEWQIQHQREPQRDTAANAGNDGTQGTLADTSSAGRPQRNTAILAGEPGHVTWRKIAPGNVAALADTNGQRGPLPAQGQQPAEQITQCAARRATQPGMGGNTHGLSTWLDRHQWPALPGQTQQAGEPPRIISKEAKCPNRNQRLKALGNAIVPQQIKPIFETILAVERQMESVA